MICDFQSPLKIKSFEFSLRELSGAMGDFGTLFPLSVGYTVVCGLNPAGFLVMMGLANIATGLIYRLALNYELVFVALTVLVSVLSNMALGFIVGMAAYHATRAWRERT